MSLATYNLEQSSRARHRARLPRPSVVGRAARRSSAPWSEVPLDIPGGTSASLSGRPPRISIAACVIVALVILSHLLLAWYLIHRRAVDPIPTPKHQVELALERPPPPKVDPPKPPPPPARPQRVAKVVPPIQETPPAPSAAPPVASAEPPVAVEPVAAATPAPPPVLPVTPPFGRAGYLNNPAPPYPAVAARLGLEGTVLLRVRVLSSGRVESVQVQKSSGSQPLDDAALLTVKKWLFTPSKRGDTPIDGWATVPIEFKLDQ